MPEPTITQPHAMPLSPELIASLTCVIAPETGGAQPDDVVFHDAHSNDVAELRFQDGRTLMVKRGRYQWTAPRFRASRLASRLLNGRAGVVAPAPIEIPDDLDTQPVEAYWRVELPTLQELWPSLDDHARTRALQSLGGLVARVHSVRVCGHGPLDVAEDKPTFEAFMHADLGYRLYPALAAQWPDAIEILERLRDAIDAAAERVPADGSALLHNDLHMGNVLCEHDEVSSRCVGVLDLETAFAGPREADLAVLEVHHGPLFSQPVEGNWFEHVQQGYDRPLDALLMTFFRAYHLLNMGFYSAIVGHHEHARKVGSAALAETERLGNGSLAPGERS
jgi:aminoglycoside phosphotransferase (APT) family kinase protein